MKNNSTRFLSHEEIKNIICETLPGVSFEEIKIGLVRNNYSATTNDLFIKILGPSANVNKFMSEPKNTHLLNNLGIKNITSPITANVLNNEKYGVAVSAWERIPVSDSQLNIGTNLLDEVWNILQDVHDAPVKEFTHLQFFLSHVKETIAVRKTSKGWNEALSEVTEIFSILENYIINDFTYDEKDKLVVSHGDTHAGNIIFSEDEKYVLCDFESMCLAPKEWDVASLQHNISRIKKKPEIWNNFKTIHRNDLNWDMVDILEGIKAVSGISYLIANHEYKLALSRGNALMPYAKKEGPFPSVLAEHPGR